MASFGSAARSGLILRLLLAGCCAGLLAGCADSERLSDSFPGAFPGNTDRSPTASIAEPTRPVQAHPLTPPPGAYSSRPVASYSAPAYRSPHLASSRSWNGSDTQTGAVRESIAGWTAEGGMPIVVAQGENADIIARRYGIPTAALVHTNGYASAGQIRPGARIIIPTYNAALASSSGVRFEAARAAHLRAEKRLHEARLHLAHGSQSVAERRRAEKHLAKEERAEARSAKEERMERHKLAMRTHDEREREKSEKEAERTMRSLKPHMMRPEADAVRTPHVYASAVPATPRRVDHMPTATVEPERAQEAALSDSGMPEFRWPARGRIIEGYHKGRNDGIDIALPEGTAVKAAEAGVVVYAGNEVKGYGNLVLIRHPNGFVTAYANNAQLDVTRGEHVRRGQVIAHSGESGDATSPQLHFEVRKGATPVDPTQYLARL